MRKRKLHSAELQQQLVRLVRTGRTPEELAGEFEPSAQAIRSWVKQAELDEGIRTDGLKTDEREELVRLRRENARLKEEREILSKPRTGSRRRPRRSQSDLLLHRRAPGHVLHPRDVPCAGSLRRIQRDRKPERSPHRARIRKARWCHWSATLIAPREE